MMNYLLEEGIQHGDTRFPFCVYKVNFSEGHQQVLPCHWHDEYEFIRVSRGSATFKIGDKLYPVRENQSILVNSGELHSAYCEEDTGCSYSAIVFDLTLLGGGYNDPCPEEYLTSLLHRQHSLPTFISGDDTWEKELNSLLVRLVEKYQRKLPGYELSIKGTLFLILSLIAESDRFQTNTAREAVPKKGRTSDIKKVIAYIRQNYSRRIYLEEMAALVEMNRYNFCRFFKDYTGMTPIEFLNVYRIDEASRLLQSGRCNVTEAALQCGFENMSYFTKIFRRYKKFAPSKLKHM